MANVTGEAADSHNKGLWKLSKWGERALSTQQGAPHLPPLRRSEYEDQTNDNKKKAEFLLEKFFPGIVDVDLSDVDDILIPKRAIEIESVVTPDEFEAVIMQLPRGKAPGPDEIPNEILQLVLPEWKIQLAEAICQLFQNG